MQNTLYKFATLSVREFIFVKKRSQELIDDFISACSLEIQFLENVICQLRTFFFT